VVAATCDSNSRHIFFLQTRSLWCSVLTVRVPAALRLPRLVIVFEHQPQHHASHVHSQADVFASHCLHDAYMTVFILCRQHVVASADPCAACIVLLDRAKAESLLLATRLFQYASFCKSLLV
jgi:hypothetical protein